MHLLPSPELDIVSAIQTSIIYAFDCAESQQSTTSSGISQDTSQWLEVLKNVLPLYFLAMCICMAFRHVFRGWDVSSITRQIGADVWCQTCHALYVKPGTYNTSRLPVTGARRTGVTPFAMSAPALSTFTNEGLLQSTFWNNGADLAPRGVASAWESLHSQERHTCISTRPSTDINPAEQGIHIIMT